MASLPTYTFLFDCAVCCWQVDYLPRYAAMLRQLIIKGANNQENPEKPLVRYPWGASLHK